MLDKINYLETTDNKYPLVFSINVMESIQDKYGSMDKWLKLVQNTEEPSIKAIKFFMTESINEGIDIENEKTGHKREFVTLKQVGRILTEVGINNTANEIMNTISQSVSVTEKNEKTTKNQKD